MSKRVTIYLLTTVAAVVALALTFGVATGSSAAQASAAKVRGVNIVMADPGCHWFSVAGKNKARLAVSGTTVVPKDVLYDQKYGRLRSLTVGPDGALYVTTSNGSGDRIVRIAPHAPPAPALTSPGYRERP